jgi:hypothetical protein
MLLNNINIIIKVNEFKNKILLKLIHIQFTYIISKIYYFKIQLCNYNTKFWYNVLFILSRYILFF